MHTRNKTFHRILFFCLAMVIAYVGLTFYRKSQVRHLDAAMRQLYASADSIQMNPQLTQQEITKAKDIAEKMDGNLRKQTVPKIEFIQQKFNAYQALRQIYQNQHIQTDVLNHTTPLIFKEEVTDEQIEQLTVPSKWTNHDKESDQLTTAIKNAQKDWGQFQSARDFLAKIATDSIQGPGTLKPLMKELVTMQQALDGLKEHPQYRALEKASETAAKQIVDQVLSQQEKEAYAPEEINALSDWKYTEAQIIGTALDNRPKVALTFDDGPNEQYTEPVLEVLKRHNIKATFFLQGQMVEVYPELAKKIAEAGHWIGNHSYDHANFDEISDDAIVRQISLTNDAIQRVTGQMPVMYRAPYGNGSHRIQYLFPEMHSILWDVDTLDWRFQDTQKTIDHTLPQIKGDVIILMHDRFSVSAETLERLIQYLKEHHYRFVSPLEIAQ